MKTIHTDKMGLLPWAMFAVAASMFFSAYRAFAAGDGNNMGISLGAGILFTFLGGKRIWDVRAAKAEGRDHTVVRVKNDR